MELFKCPDSSKRFTTHSYTKKCHLLIRSGHHSHIHSQTDAMPSGEIWTSVSCQRALRRADCRGPTTDPPISRRALYLPSHSRPEMIDRRMMILINNSCNLGDDFFWLRVQMNGFLLLCVLSAKRGLLTELIQKIHTSTHEEKMQNTYPELLSRKHLLTG